MSTEGVRPLHVDGEYDQVTRASADVDALRRAHGTPVTRAEAEAMIAALGARFDVNVAVRFGAKAGRCSWSAKYTTVARTYADGSPVLTWRGKPYRRRVYLRDAVGRAIWCLAISLPTQEGRTTETGGWGLRAGLVLHEFVHAVIQARGYSMRAAGHGPLFTWLLDALVADWKETK